MKISHKLILSFLLVASLASITAIFTLRSYQDIDNAFVRSVKDSAQMIEVLHDLRHTGIQIVASTGEYGFIHVGTTVTGQADMANEGGKRITPSHRALVAALKHYEELVLIDSADDAETFQTITASANKLITGSDEIIDLMMTSDDKNAILVKRQQLDVGKTEFLKHIFQALEKEAREQIQDREEVQSTIALATRQTLAVTILTFILALLSGLYISFLISRRIRNLKIAIRNVGAGELETRIEITSKDEIGDLARSFNKMVGDLKLSRSNLAASEILTEKVWESMVDFVVVCDLDLTITKVNKATLKLNGYEENELIGKSVNMLMADRPFSKKGVDALRKNGFTADLDKINLNKDGTLTPITMSLSVLRNEQGEDLGIVCVGKDIGERKREEFQRQGITEIVEAMITTSGLDELFIIAYRAINRVISAENCYIALHDPVTGLIRYEFWKDKVRSVPEPHPIIKNFGSYVLESRQPLLLTDELKERMHESGAVSNAKYSPSWMGVPLRLATSTIGILVVQDYEKHDVYSPRDLQFLGAIGDQLALAIERTRAEEVRMRSEEKFRDLFDNAPVAYHELDSEGLYTRINHTEELLLGYTSDEMKGRHPAEFIVEKVSREAVAAKLSGKMPLHAVERTFIRKDGARISVLTEDRLIYDEHGKIEGIRTILQDITARKRAEKALLESEEHFRFLNDLTQTTRTLADPEQMMEVTSRMLGEYLGASRCAYAFMEADDERFTITHDYVNGCASTVGNYNLSLFGARAEATLKSGRTLVIRNVETELLPDDGADSFNDIGVKAIIICPLVKDGSLRAMMAVHQTTARDWTPNEIAIVQDVVERCWATIARMTADDALRASEENFRELVENANDVIYTLDLAGNFTSLNRAGEKITGYSRAEAIQKSLADVISPKDVPRVFERFAMNKQGTAQPNYEIEIIAKDGCKVTMDISSRMIIQGGVPVGLQGIGRDITESLKARKELERFNRKLQQSNRELQDFAYVASHDLQEPLRKVQTFSDRLKTKYSDKLEGEGLDYLERMRSAASRMQLLIQDLLTFSRVSTKAQPFVPVDLAAITQEVLSDLEVNIEGTGATIELKDLPTIDADPLQMRQLIQNLIGNALKFRQKDTPPFITVNAQQVTSNGNGGGPHCQISVKDNGIGFDEKYTQKIFAVFQRLHARDEYEGSGVGLSICRKIAERHNGSITAHSRPGDGSTFIVTLPLEQSIVEND